MRMLEKNMKKREKNNWMKCQSKESKKKKRWKKEIRKTKGKKKSRDFIK